MNDKAIVLADQAGQVQPAPSGQSLSLFDKIADPMKAIAEMGVFIAQSGMFGKMNENQGKVLAWHCLTKKKDPFDFKREYHILEDGQITKRADAMAADFIRRGFLPGTSSFPVSYSLIAVFLLALIGLAAILSIMVRVGPFS